MSHDALCPVRRWGKYEDCQCDLIREVRADYVEYLEFERYLLDQMNGELSLGRLVMADLDRAIRIARGEDD